MNSIAIVGAGLSGSNLAAWLNKQNFNGQVDIYDPQVIYKKPCGNVILPEALKYLPLHPDITNEIEEYEIIVNNKKVVSFSLEKRERWLVIDKERLVGRLRDLWIKKFEFIPRKVDPRVISSKYDLVIDARGPFSDNGLKKVLIARGIFEAKKPIGDKIILGFDTENIGLFWIFPFKDYVNMGYGALYVTNPIEKLEVISEKLKVALYDKTRVRTSILTIDYPLKKIHEEKIIRVGEALGLVLALGGEGNRFAIISSKLLADSLILSNIMYYKKNIKRIYREVIKQAVILSLLVSTKNRNKVAEAMSDLDVDFYKKFLQGQFILRKALLVGLKNDVFTRNNLKIFLSLIDKYLRSFTL